ncbi:MAG TPA: DUF5666 domain-containing protein [Bryobacteraceae bacterium]|nr:DUF5666 domain-containing protein [Bryobacteraceae bacterium]
MMKAIQTSLCVLAISTGLFAHGGAEHLTGTVKALNADSLTIETTKHETLTIALTAKTVAMKSKAKGDLKDLKAGDRVVVHAEKNKAGQFEAEEVDFGPAPAAAAKAAH